MKDAKIVWEKKKMFCSARTFDPTIVKTSTNSGARGKKGISSSPKENGDCAMQEQPSLKHSEFGIRKEKKKKKGEYSLSGGAVAGRKGSTGHLKPAEIFLRAKKQSTASGKRKRKSGPLGLN